MVKEFILTEIYSVSEVNLIEHDVIDYGEVTYILSFNNWLFYGCVPLQLRLKIFFHAMYWINITKLYNWKFTNNWSLSFFS